VTTPIFRTPEEVAPELGMTKTELRRYCRESGINTRLSNRRIMLHEDDIARIIVWVRERKDDANDWTKDAESDPFA
jgi:NADP-dependent 3-hydroxy acid dehydrogenase YdfG